MTLVFLLGIITTSMVLVMIQHGMVWFGGVVVTAAAATLKTHFGLHYAGNCTGSQIGSF